MTMAHLDNCFLKGAMQNVVILPVLLLIALSGSLEKLDKRSCFKSTIQRNSFREANLILRAAGSFANNVIPMGDIQCNTYRRDQSVPHCSYRCTFVSRCCVIAISSVLQEGRDMSLPSGRQVSVRHVPKIPQRNLG